MTFRLAAFPITREAASPRFQCRLSVAIGGDRSVWGQQASEPREHSNVLPTVCELRMCPGNLGDVLKIYAWGDQIEASCRRVSLSWQANEMGYENVLALGEQTVK